MEHLQHQTVILKEPQIKTIRHNRKNPNCAYTNKRQPS